jgi:hypothetical protein
MHRVLFILDILLEIFTHLTSDKSSLEALARACKTFHQLSMDLLWADMDDGIEPLLGCVARLHPLIYRHNRKVGAG